MSAEQLAQVLGDRRWLALTGAGVSTDSGIPDYRGPDAPVRSPMTGQEFRGGFPARQRYWARSYLGWARMGTAAPNSAHHALADLERRGRVAGVITQNVDGLHTRAGSRAVVDLHGRIERVVCLACGDSTSRATLQQRLERLNTGFGDGCFRVLPDGDVDLEDTAGFVVADCLGCGGVLKPDVVFFGENVPVERVQACHQLVDAAEALVVLGSSLHVFSGRRFVIRAAQRGIPVVIVNRGPTRADTRATLKLDAGCAETLASVLQPGPQLTGAASLPIRWQISQNRATSG